MNESEFVFDIQERIAQYSNLMSKDDYWSFYNDFVKGIQNQFISPISVIVMNTSLLRKLAKPEKFLYELPECVVEISIANSLKQITVEKEIINTSKNIIEMVNAYLEVFWLSAALLQCLLDCVVTIVLKSKEVTTDNTQEVDQVGITVCILSLDVSKHDTNYDWKHSTIPPIRRNHPSSARNY